MIAKTVFRTTLLLSSMFLTHAAQATPLDCPLDYTAASTTKVWGTSPATSAVSNCQYLPAEQGGNNSADELDKIDEAGFFDTDDWDLVEKVELPEGAGSSGSWMIGDADFENYDYMIVFKNGAKTNLVAFLFNETAQAGGWSTPFTSVIYAAAGTGKDVSHFLVMQREGSIDVPPEELPEPGVLALMGVGIAGIALRRRRPDAS